MNQGMRFFWFLLAVGIVALLARIPGLVMGWLMTVAGAVADLAQWLSREMNGR